MGLIVPSSLVHWANKSVAPAAGGAAGDDDDDDDGDDDEEEEEEEGEEEEDERKTRERMRSEFCAVCCVFRPLSGQFLR